MLRHYVPYVGHNLLFAHGQIIVEINEKLGATHVDKLGHGVLFGHEASDALEKRVKNAIVQHGYLVGECCVTKKLFNCFRGFKVSLNV